MKNKKNFFRGFAIFFVGSILLAGCTLKPVDVSDEITKANKAFMEAFKKGDAHALAMLYTSDAKIFPPNSDVIESREAIQGYWETGLKMGLNDGLLETVSAESYGNVAIEEGRYKLYVGEGQLADHGKYLVIWKKEDGQWKLYKDIFNTSIPKSFDTEAEKVAISNFLNKFMTAFNDRDIEAMSSLLTEDMFSWGSDPAELWNKQQLTEIWKQMLTKPFKLNVIGEPTIKIAPDGYSAFVVQQYFMPSVSEKLPFRNGYHLIKLNDEWKIFTLNTACIPKNKDLPKIDKVLNK